MSMLCNASAQAKESVGEILSGAGMTILTGVLVVFSTLLVLTFIFWLFGKVFGRSKTGEKRKEEKSAKAPTAVQAAPKAPAVQEAPAVQAGISGEVVAAIAAAVACMAPEGKRYTVRSVSRAAGERPVWSAAGLAESTRPF